MFLYESFVTLMILAVALAGSQPILQNNEGQGPLPTFGELLKRHNIQLTQPALVDALRNTDPEVRDLAANKLAEDKAVETIPAIKDALASEKVPWTRMNIALALAEMGESSPLASTLWRITVRTKILPETFGHVLQNICSDSTATVRHA